MGPPTSPNQPVTVADFEVVSAQPRPAGFTLAGQGRDGSEYILDLRLDMPMNRETQVVLGEMLAQSECRLSRVPTGPKLKSGAKRIKQPAPPSGNR